VKNSLLFIIVWRALSGARHGPVVAGLVARLTPGRSRDCGPVVARHGARLRPGRSRAVTGPRPGWRPGRGPAGARFWPGSGLASLRPSGLSSLAGRWVYKGVTRQKHSLSAAVVLRCRHRRLNDSLLV